MHKPTDSPRWWWGALGAGLVTGALGGLALWAHVPALIPSLGPSIIMQCYLPFSPNARPYQLMVGQLLGIGAGLIAVSLTGTGHLPSELASGALSPGQAMAAVVGVMLTLLAQVAAGAIHPPGASTALLFAVGSIRPNLEGISTVIWGILLVGIFGEGVRRWQAANMRREIRRTTTPGHTDHPKPHDG